MFGRANGYPEASTGVRIQRLARLEVAFFCITALWLVVVFTWGAMYPAISLNDLGKFICLTRGVWAS